MMVTAIAERWAPPMPTPSAVGISPTMIAERRHQNRAQPRAARLDDRQVARHAPRPQDVGVVHLENRVLLDDPEQQQDAERAPQVQRPAGHPDREQREGDRQRQHGHDDERLHEALELGGEHHVDEDARQGDRHHQVARWSHRGSASAPASGSCSRAASAASPMMRRRSFDDSSSAWPGATSAFRLIEYWRFVRVIRVGPESAFQLGDVVDPDRLSRWRRHRQPADHVDVATLTLQHADLDRILLARFAVRGDLVVARHHQPQRVADRRHAHAEVGGARIDRRPPAPRGWRCCSRTSRRRDSASAWPSRAIRCEYS